ncbi:MAG: tetraacyldisaccharide 4'-kinase [Lautropia sp.]|nr:tetraacyldisaccharide 4'-kinase [Lautropia sp.]
MIGERLRQRLEGWLLRIWFGPASSTDRLLESLLAPLLRPLSWLVATLARQKRRRLNRTGPHTRPAVVIVGNLVAGGSGKTPLVIALCKALSQHGLKVGLLARGYRRESDAALLVSPTTTAHDAGDEALLLARSTGRPVAVGARRAEALALLLQQVPDLDVVLSDDGLQHVALPRRLELVVMHAKGLGNGRCLPAGPLREPPDRLTSVDAVLLPAPLGAVDCPAGTPRCFQTHVRVAGIRTLDGTRHWAPEAFRQHVGEESLAAVAGIARPERFFETLLGLGLKIHPYPLPDHAQLDARWLADLPGHWIIMTAKDAVKLDDLTPALHERCLVLEIEAVPEHALVEWLIAELAPPRSS